MKRLMTTLLAIAFVAPAMTDDVTVEIFVRAESDHMIRTNTVMMGVDFGKMIHLREPTTTHAVTAKDVPVDAFWSVTIDNADGYLEANDLGVNSSNDFSAKQNEDGSHTLHFGGCDDGRVNCIPITSGWNHAIRTYQPRGAILDGSWSFPAPQSVDSDAMVARGPRRERA